MADDAHWSAVGDYVTLIRGTTYKGDLVGKPGPALLGLGSIEPGGGFRSTGYKTYGGDCPEELMLFPGDIYASLKGATKDGTMIGSVARVPPTVPTGRLTQDTVKLVFRSPNLADMRYVYWVLRTPQYRNYCTGRATGSAVVALSRSDFLAYPVPPLSTWRNTLAASLDEIEKHIELNRRTSATLEGMARALFQSWFVDFDPVRAKIDGRWQRGQSLPGLPAHLYDLFPDRLVDSELGEIPEGWRAGTLADMAELNPEVWQKSTRPLRIRYVDLSNTKWGRIDAIAEYGANDAPSRAQRVLRAGDSIVGTVRPGNGSFALIDADGLTGSTGFAQLRPKSSALAELAYLAATARDNIDALALLADGGAYPAVRPDVVAATPVALSPDPVVGDFHRHAGPLIASTGACERESRTLATLRDTLLPKLIAGELRVKDAKRFMEAVA